MSVIGTTNLDEAWAEVEAALPGGSAVFGPWALVVCVSRNPYGWAAWAGPFADPSQVREFGETPTAALLALAARLREVPA